MSVSLPDEQHLEAAPSAAKVYRAIYAEGAAELKRPLGGLFWSGFAAGIAMALSLLAEGFLSYYLPEGKWTPLISKLGYSVGFLVVILGRQQLFTENTITPIFPVLRERDRAIFWRLLRLTSVVLAANLIGAVVIAGLLTLLHPVKDGIYASLIAVSAYAVEGSAWQHFSGAIFAGWIIASIVWLLPFAGGSRVLVIVGFTYLIGLGSFSHVIAGSVEACFLWMNEDVAALDLILRFVLPTLAGNILGGVALVAGVNYGQAVAGEEDE